MVFLIPSFILSVIFGILYIVLKALSLVALLPFIGFIFEWFFNFSQNILSFIYTFLILTILSPINSILSAKYDTLLTGKNHKTGAIQFISDLWRAVKINGLLLVFYYITTLVIRILFPNDDDQWLAKALYFFTSSFYFGFSFFDYSFERYRYSIQQTIRLGIKNWQVVLIGGVIFNLLFQIPILGIMISPYIATLLTTDAFLLKNKFE